MTDLTQDVSVARGPGASAAAPAGKLQLSNEWQTWVAQSLLAGEGVEPLVQALITGGVDEDRARREVSLIATSPILHAAERELSYLKRIAMVVELQRTIKREVPQYVGVPRRAKIAADEFFRDYFVANRPVVLSDFLHDWPAFGRWSPQYFADAIGDVEIEAIVGREADPYCDRNFQALRRKMPMRDYAQLVAKAGVSNDIYMISNSRNLNLPALAPLRAEMAARPDLIASERWEHHLSLWFGPEGTVTPLHHDQNNNMFCQMYGEKRIRLISPDQMELLREMEGGFYSPVSLDSPDLDRFPWLAHVKVEEVTLKAGEALFIPVGWWHDVRSLSVSINLSLINFVVPNEYSQWYKPGLL